MESAISTKAEWLERRWWFLAIVISTVAALYWLAPVLSPFLLAALLAYMGDPLVDRLERKMSRGWAVAVVFLGLMLILLPLPLLIVPLIEKQLATLITKVPVYIDWLQDVVAPWLSRTFGIDPQAFDLSALRQAVAGHWKDVGGVAASIARYLSQSGMAVLAVIANALLLPIVTFYMLRDWDILIARIHELIPRALEPTAVKLVSECDDVLGAFMRGQVSVMAALGTIYAVGLSIVGLDFGLLIGFSAGLVSFVPYLGFVVGIITAGIAALFQFQDVIHLVYVALVFGIGQLLESFVLTPWLLGDRIGLHPVLVIFAVMAGGQLFGFFGVLLALPAAAVVMVVLRHMHERYRRSDFYGAESGG